MTDLPTFLESLGFAPVRNNSGEWSLHECWKCGGKDKVFFNINKMVGLCHKCPRTLYLKDIAVELAGVSVRDVHKFVAEHQSTERSLAGFRDTVLQGLLGSEIEQSLVELPEIPLPKEYRSFERAHGTVIGQRAMDYMLKRGFKPGVLISMGFGYCPIGKYENRVIVPFWEDGKLVYWQARDFTGVMDDNMKVLNPDKETVFHGKSSVLFNYDGARHSKTIVLTESWGSALAVSERYAMGLNGKSMSEVQEQKLIATESDSIIVLLDHGTVVESWNIANRLSPYKEVFVGSLPELDPNEVPRSVLLETIKSAAPYTREAYIRQRVETVLR